jgi:glucosylceramidase
MYKIFLLCLVCAAVHAEAQTVNVWLTTDDQKTLLQPQGTASFAEGVSSAVPTILIDERRRYQTIQGFGAAFTDSAAYLLNEKVPSAQLHDVIMSLFDHQQGIGISFGRNPIGASDLARFDYSFDDQAAGATDPTLSAFSIAHDQTDIIPLILLAKSINPELKILATPWSPPGWMKTSDSMIGGTLLPSAYGPFADYLVKYVQAYAAAGVRVDYLALQNEPDYLPPDYPGERMLPAEQLNILKNFVLPAMTAANLNTQVLVFDTNWDDPTFPRTVLADPTVAASPLVAGVSWHWYAGNPGAMENLHEFLPSRRQFVTEASGGTWIADEVKTDFETIIQSMRNWSVSYIKWSLALDENRGPHTGGCGTCTPLVFVDETSGAVTNAIDYYTLGHFSKFVWPGATHVYSSNAPGLISAAFLNPDGSRALVVYNDTTASRTFQIAWRGQSFTYTLAGLSGATLTWTGGPVRYSTMRTSATEQIQASSYTAVSGLETENTMDTDSGFDLGYASSGSWAEFDRIDFGHGVSTVNARVSSAADGGTVEFHLDRVDGPLIATATAPATGGWQTWTTVTAPVSGAIGVRNLYVVLKDGTTAGIANLNWFRFQ